MKIEGEGGGANLERVAYVPLCMSMSVMAVRVSVQIRSRSILGGAVPCWSM
jgi:hypothetical protein